MYVYIRIYMYVYVYIRLYVYMYVHIQAPHNLKDPWQRGLEGGARAALGAPRRTGPRPRSRIYTYIARIYTFIYVYVCIYTYVCLYVYMYIYIYVYVCMYI